MPRVQAPLKNAKARSWASNTISCVSRDPVHHNDLVAPVELIGLARRERQRHIGVRRLARVLLAPGPGVTANRVVTPLVAERPQLLENPDQSQPLSRRRLDVRSQQPIELLFPSPQLRARLHLALVGKRGLVRPQDLANRIAGQSQIASDLFDRFALNKVLAPYPSDRLHNQHPPPPASRQSGQPNKPIIGGSILDADPPPQGVTFLRRITGCDENAFPAHAGMNREMERPKVPEGGVPRPRGDEPGRYGA